jgi:hypothetical protein
MTNGELVTMLTKQIKAFSKSGLADIQRNAHLCGRVDLTQEQLDAALVGFANTFAYERCCLDLALSAADLKE